DGADTESDAGIVVAELGRAVGAHADVVAEDGGPGGGEMAVGADDDAAGPGGGVTAVGADDVVDHVRVLSPDDGDAGAPVADRDLAGDVGADVVALNHVVAAAADSDAVVGIAGDDVAQVGGRPADGVGVAVDDDAGALLRIGLPGAGLVRADQVV